MFSVMIRRCIIQQQNRKVTRKSLGVAGFTHHALLRVFLLTIWRKVFFIQFKPSGVDVFAVKNMGIATVALPYSPRDELHARYVLIDSSLATNSHGLAYMLTECQVVSSATANSSVQSAEYVNCETPHIRHEKGDSILGLRGQQL